MNLRLLTVGLLLTVTAALAEPQFPTIHSDTPLPLDSLIALGFRHSPELRQAGLNTRLNNIGRLNAIGNFLPSIGVGASFSQDDVEAPSPDGRSSSQYLSLDETIFQGGQRYFLYRMAQTQVDINNLTVEDAHKSLVSAISRQYMLVLTQDQFLALTRRLLEQSENNYNLARARFEVGSVTELDVLQAEIEVGRARNDVASAERDLQSAREILNQLAGLDITSSYPLEPAGQIVPFEFDIEGLVASAYDSRSDLRIAELTVTRSNHNINVYRSDYLPTITLGANFTRSESHTIDESWTLNPDRRFNSYTLNLNWNLFNGFAREYNIATQVVARDRAAEDLRRLRLSTERDVRNAYYDLATVYDQLQITGRNRELADRQLNLERERYRLGATSQLALRDAQVVYARAETDHLQKQLEYQSSVIALELAVGRPIR